MKTQSAFDNYRRKEGLPPFQLSIGQTLMAEDGAPFCLFMTEAERKVAWEKAAPVASYKETVEQRRRLIGKSVCADNHSEKIGVVKSQGLDKCEVHWPSGAVSFIEESRLSVMREEKTENRGTNEMISLTTNTRGNTVMATKPKKKVAAKKPDAPDNRSKAGIEFDVRNGTVREKLIDALHGAKGKFIAVKDLLKTCYGSMNTENTGALKMSIKGAESTIKSKRLPYRIDKKVDEKTKEMSFGLFAKTAKA